ncbi:MAG: hypothetical protein U5K43_13535 [Halofilum sp. (in: g-proteobacteria)]|nr:hypothetical protein [Halofilum sp. (in: g-proteobacteria)]
MPVNTGARRPGPVGRAAPVPPVIARASAGWLAVGLGIGYLPILPGTVAALGGVVLALGLDHLRRGCAWRWSWRSPRSRSWCASGAHGISVATITASWRTSC